jgi:hypothetical protein
MEHDEAVRTKATERYLLGELEAEVRDQFEEHLFECPDCALDLRAASAFLEHSKVELSAPESTAVRAPEHAPTKPGWLNWLRPAIAVPVMACLLGVIAYQNFVTLPASKMGDAAPRVLASVSLLAANTRGMTIPSIDVNQGNPFLVFVDVPPGGSFVSYRVELYDPTGKKERSLPISSAAVKDTLTVQIPPVQAGDGAYRLVILGSDASGETTEVASYPLNVHFVK